LLTLVATDGTLRVLRYYKYINKSVNNFYNVKIH